MDTDKSRGKSSEPNNKLKQSIEQASSSKQNEGLSTLAPSLGANQFQLNCLINSIYQTSILNEGDWQAREQILKKVDALSLQKSQYHISLVKKHLFRALRMVKENNRLQQERSDINSVLAQMSPASIIVTGNWELVAPIGSCAQLLYELGWVFDNNRLVPNLTSQTKREIFSFVRRYDCYCSIVNSITNSEIPDYLLYVSRFNQENDQFLIVLIEEFNLSGGTFSSIAADHGVTERELSIITNLLSQSDLNVVSSKLKITLSTLRQHIKNIFSKLNVRSQSELISFVLNRSVYDMGIRLVDDKNKTLVYGASQTRYIHLANNRTLSYSDIGDPAGIPVVHFHALNGSRHELMEFSELFRSHGIRLITLDRAGYGYTSELEHYDLSTHVQDVLMLLEHLGLEQVVLLSHSAGSAHALCSAYHLPDKVAAVHCVSAVPPIEYIVNSPEKSSLNSTLAKIARMVPAITQPVMELIFVGQSVTSLLSKAALTKKINLFYLSESDIDYYTKPERIAFSVQSMIESLRQGTKTWARESAYFNRPWPFSVRRLKLPVTFWHGESDLLVPSSMVQELANDMLNADVRVVENETHLLLYRQVIPIIKTIKRSFEKSSNQ